MASAYTEKLISTAKAQRTQRKSYKFL